MIVLDNKKQRITVDIPPIIQELPKREGKAPEVEVKYPCLQKEEMSPEHLRNELLDRAVGLPGVSLKPTDLNVPALALNMEDTTDGTEEAFIRDKEFALIRTDGSIHMPLELAWGEHVLKRGWACIHPLVIYMAGALPPQNFIVYAPRDEEELNIVWRIVQCSYYYATGWIEPVEL